MIPAPPFVDWRIPTPHNGQRLLEWQAKRLVNTPRPVFRAWQGPLITLTERSTQK